MHAYPALSVLPLDLMTQRLLNAHPSIAPDVALSILKTTVLASLEFSPGARSLRKSLAGVQIEIKLHQARTLWAKILGHRNPHTAQKAPWVHVAPPSSGVVVLDRSASVSNDWSAMMRSALDTAAQNGGYGRRTTPPTMIAEDTSHRISKEDMQRFLGEIQQIVARDPDSSCVIEFEPSSFTMIDEVPPIRFDILDLSGSMTSHEEIPASAPSSERGLFHMVEIPYTEAQKDTFLQTMMALGDPGRRLTAPTEVAAHKTIHGLLYNDHGAEE